MQNTEEDLLTDIVQQVTAVKRKQLLPWWIKVFMWIFLVLGFFAPFGIIFSIFGYSFNLSLYGLETNEPISIMGISIIVIFLLKGLTSYGLLKETDWAITLGIIDAISGIIICILVMLFALFNVERYVHVSIRLELILLIPYLTKLFKIKSFWENAIQI